VMLNLLALPFRSSCLKVDSFSLVLAADGLVISEAVLLDVLSKLSYDSVMLC